jgi:hypothetical protein
LKRRREAPRRHLTWRKKMHYHLLLLLLIVVTFDVKVKIIIKKR